VVYQIVFALLDAAVNASQGGRYAAQVRVVHNLDGSLSIAPVLVNPPIDPEWRAYADSAVRAVIKCNPLQVPPRYLSQLERWRKMTLHFSPDSALSAGTASANK
jgi:hypothetical protein